MRRLVLVAVMVAAGLCAGCSYEVRGNEIWACGTVDTDRGPVEGCADTGMRAE